MLFGLVANADCDGMIVAMSFKAETHGFKNGSAPCTDLANISDKQAQLNVVMQVARFMILLLLLYLARIN